MRRIRVCLFVFASSLAGSLTLGGVAHAVPPSNDEITGATTIGPLPFSNTVDITEATVSDDELAWNTFCNAPAIEKAVWYTVTPAGSGEATIDVTGSDYSAGILVLTGTPGALTPVVCGPGLVSGPYSEGQTTYIMVFGDGGSPASGNLELRVREAVPAPKLDVTVDPIAFVDRFGAATITGTVTCTAPANDGVVFDVAGTVSQRVGRGFVEGFFFISPSVPCDGTTSKWSAIASPNKGKFAGGKAATVAFSFACGPDQCSQGYVEGTIQMNRGKPR